MIDYKHFQNYQGISRIKHMFLNIATGFLMIKREVFDVLCKKHPDATFVNDIPGYASEKTNGNFWLFFETLVHPDTKRYLSENCAFYH